MNAVYQAIRTKIETELPAIQFVRLWNNQLALMDANQQYAFNFPAVFIGFQVLDYIQLGNGIQECNGVIDFHICDLFYNGQNIEENTQILQTRLDVYTLFNNWKSDSAKTSPFLRINEVQDTEHSMVYHFIQSYAVRWIEDSAQRPVGGVVVDPPIELVINKDIVITNQDLKTSNSL